MVDTPPSWDALAKSENLTLETGLATNLATATGELLARVLAVKSTVEENLPKLEPFVPKLSGADLANAMNGRGDRIKELLGAHVAVLEDMRATFINAGKVLTGADTDSAYELNVLNANRDSLASYGSQQLEYDMTSYELFAPDIYDEFAFWERVKNTSKPDDLLKLLPPTSRYTQGGVKFEPASLTQDYYGMYFGAEELFKMRADGYQNTPIEDAAKLWSWTGNTLARESQALFTLMNGLDGKWEGDGRQAADAATGAYIGSTVALANETVSMSDGLVNVAGWRYILAHRLTDAGCYDEISGKSYTQLAEIVEDARAVIDAIYVPSVQASAAAIPALTTPEFKQDDPPRPPGDPTSPAGPGANRGSPLGGLQAPRPGLPTTPVADPSAAATPSSSSNSSGNPLSSLSGLAEQAASALQSPSSTSPASSPSSSNSPAMMAASTQPTGTGSGAAGSGLGAAKGAASLAKEANKPTAGFPRAGAMSQAPLAATAARAAAASTSAMPGSPGAAGAAGRNAGGEEKARKTPSCLISEEALNAAMGAPQVVSRPTVDE
ncbi:hypothetical protein [Nocardia sp. XZ_19_385]|uniref:hypothetical protein n=1 Tax=Nocardia sp. XZ_19_385 TaxID=2769488 RepID=UPI00188EECA9|nr:hypothetical protein [Nocardia sp. XZ_19_385]